MISEKVLACPACKYAVRGGKCVGCKAWVFGAHAGVRRARTKLRDWTLERQYAFISRIRDLAYDLDPIPQAGYTRPNA